MRRMHFASADPLCIADLLGDFVAYRSLRPQDARIQWAPPACLPRKLDPTYAEVVLDLLHAARAVERPNVLLEQVLMIGDNAATDGVMFQHLRQRLGGKAHGVIVDETGGPPTLSAPVHGLAQADGWATLPHWANELAAQGGVIDERTVVLLDVDKTLLGARGRNDRVIDGARRRAMAATIREVVGERWSQARFDAALTTFNHGRFHHFTGDNQDCVALLCLIATSELIDTSLLARDLSANLCDDVAQVLAAVLQAPEVDAKVRAALKTIAERVEAGDPTPFKAFREREYRETIARMNLVLPPTEQLITELCLTGEVIDVAQRWQRQGALLFALSDKPDEAALPPAALAAEGYQPLHRIPTHVVRSE